VRHPCLDCGCLIPKGITRCAACSKPNPYGAEHQRRSRLLRAAHPFCSQCGATEDLTADHIVPLHCGGHPLGKLRVLCRSCNSRLGGYAVGRRPNALLRESKGERRMPVRCEGEGAYAGWSAGELVAAGRGSAPPPSAPRLASLSLLLAGEREAGVRGHWRMRLLPKADAPASLSSLLPLGLHTSSRRDEPAPGGVAKKRRQSHDPGMPLGRCTAWRNPVRHHLGATLTERRSGTPQPRRRSFRPCCLPPELSQGRRRSWLASPLPARRLPTFA
jgi:hypothetical protein